MHKFSLRLMHDSVGCSDTDPPSWEFEISGKVIDAAEAEGALATAGGSGPQLQQQGPHSSQGGQQGPKGPPMSSFIRRLTVRLDPQQYPGSEGIINWTKAGHEGAHKDKFSIRHGTPPSCCQHFTSTPACACGNFLTDDSAHTKLGHSYTANPDRFLTNGLCKFT